MTILTSIKKLLGIAEDQTQFDIDVIMHINTVFSILSQVGAGPSTGFSLQDGTEEWVDFMAQCPKLEMVKSRVFLGVRMLFDPSLSSVVSDSILNMIKELDFRISIEPDPA